MKRIARILVPVDFSAYAHEALDYAISLARMHHARIDVLHVLEEPAFPSFYGAGALMLYGKKPDLEHDAREALQALIEAVRPPDLTMDAHIVKGHAADGIIAFAKKEQSDLIVIPTHGLTGLEHVWLGSVAERVVREAPCPVFVAKSLTTSRRQNESSEAARSDPAEHRHESDQTNPSSDRLFSERTNSVSERSDARKAD